MSQHPQPDETMEALACRLVTVAAFVGAEEVRIEHFATCDYIFMVVGGELIEFARVALRQTTELISALTTTPSPAPAN